MEQNSKRIIASMIISLSLMTGTVSLNSGFKHLINFKNYKHELEEKQLSLYSQVKHDSIFKDICSKTEEQLDIALEQDNITPREYTEKINALYKDCSIIETMVDSNPNLNSKYQKQINEINSIKSGQEREQKLGLGCIGGFAVSSILLGLSINNFPKREDAEENIL